MSVLRPVRIGAARTVAVVSALALLAACSTPEDAARREASNRTLSFHSCGEVACDGQLDGATYQVKMPQTWNGTLLLYSHGYREAEPSPPDNAPVETNATVASTDETATALLAAGYALAGSAYRRNGWAVLDGVKAGEDLRAWFRKNIGEPDRTYVWGDSLGGLITQTLAEKHPEWVSGAAPMCGVLGGLNLNLDLGLDLTYAVKTLLYPQMKLTGYTSHDDAVKTFNEAQKRVLAAAHDVKNGVPKLLAIGAITDGPMKTARFDGGTPVSQISAMAEAILTGLGYSTFGRQEIEQRIGGNPSTNVDADYPKRVSEAERKLGDLIAPGALDKAVTALQQGTRVKADDAARAAAEKLGKPTGELKDPTVTMHTEYDPLVLVQNETVFADRVFAAKHREADLLQIYTAPPASYQAPAPFGAGHCNFSVDERVGMIHVLDDWVRGGGVPSPRQVATAMKGDKGYDPAFKPGPWPATVGG
jgi:pimeloyl-ACP methyl ester carboxylesterase